MQFRDLVAEDIFNVTVFLCSYSQIGKIIIEICVEMFAIRKLLCLTRIGFATNKKNFIQIELVAKCLIS